jgi:DNA polymerase III alpha subunit|tara:strand:+ start:738 stop:1259 length:522 start_codon:yes stop_codon:yes gene_type:complete
MVEKIKTNKHGDCIYTEQDAINLLYTQPDFDITKLFFDSPDKYNDTIQELGIDLPKIQKAPVRGDVLEFDKNNCHRWHMPENYSKLNVLQWLLEKCQNEEERFRVQTEYSLFEQKKFIKVLQFLIYFVDTLRANNVVWGVGRGSSVASFCLFLIGVHKINPMLYNLDHREFLR